VNTEILNDKEKSIMLARGWGEYNPFRKPVESIRFGMVFSTENNPMVTSKIDTIRQLLDNISIFLVPEYN
jgi:hypothetical protein